MNGRLDTIQAVILIEKLKVFADEIERRNQIAARYNAALGDAATMQRVLPQCVSTWAQYTIRVPAAARDRLRETLTRQGIPTAIYYPLPLHQQAAYRHYPVAGNGLPVSEMLAREVVSLPMHPYLTDEVQDYIIRAVRESLTLVGKDAG